MTGKQKLGWLIFILSAIFFVAWGIFGKYLGLMDNATCYKFVGCNAGFFGYDSFVHLIGGMTEAAYIFLIVLKWPRLDPFHGKFHENFWKNFLIFIAVMTAVGFFWEVLEFSLDHYRMDILHENLVYPNRLAQPSNADTMGDISMGILGGAITVLCFKFSRFFDKIGQ